MKTVPWDMVQIAKDRQRQEYDIDAHMELIESIKKHGLLHAIVTRSEEGKLWLVAGERRLRAMIDLITMGRRIRYGNEELPQDYIPYVDIGELPPLEAEEAELEENIQRKDLTWQEEARTIAKLSTLRNAQVESGARSPQTAVEFVKEVRGKANANDQAVVKTNLIVAKHLDKPEVAAAKTAKEALKIIYNNERTERNLIMAEKIGQSITGSSHTLVNMDSTVWLSSCKENSFDVILTDPPYGMGADEFGDSGGLATGAHTYSDNEDYFISLIETFAPDSYRVAKENAHLYCFCDIDKFPYLKAEFTDAGWKVFRTPLIWHKPNGMRAPWPTQGPQRKYETILFAVKGDMPVTKIYGDILEHRSDENLGHAAQKPVALYRDLLNRSVTPGMTVLDAFGGTGPLLEAAHDLKCYATVIEKDPSAYAIAARRLEGLK